MPFMARFLLNIHPRIKRKRWIDGKRTDQEKSRAFPSYTETGRLARKIKMADKKDAPKEFDTCFENGPFAEWMQKMMGKQGVGSLCAEMMKKILEKQGDCCGFYWAEIMEGMRGQSRIVQEEQEETKKEESHVKGKR
jgi:hypothetical protein